MSPTIKDDIEFLEALSNVMERRMKLDGRDDQATVMGIARFRALAENLRSLKDLLEDIRPFIVEKMLKDLPHCGDPSCEACNEAKGPISIPKGQVN